MTCGPSRPRAAPPSHSRLRASHVYQQGADGLPDSARTRSGRSGRNNVVGCTPPRAGWPASAAWAARGLQQSVAEARMILFKVLFWLLALPFRLVFWVVGLALWLLTLPLRLVF